VSTLQGKKFWQFKAKGNNTGDLMLYGDIADATWWGDEVTPKDFKADLDGLGNISDLNVYINSGGGDVFAGQAIYSMLKRHNATVNVYVDGLAASIASIIAMAGDKVIMPKNAMLMVHNPWTGGMGNANDFRKLADDLDKIGESLIAVYQDKTGMDKEKIIELLDAETWMTAEEAVANGFADEIEEDKQIAASINDKTFAINGLNVDISRFKNFRKDKLTPSNKLDEIENKVNSLEKTVSGLKISDIVNSIEGLKEMIISQSKITEKREEKTKDNLQLEKQVNTELVKAKLALECEL
jgi:ATP-dependent Clp protease protease subunit